VIATVARRTSVPKFLLNIPIPSVRRFTVDEYHLFGDAGILSPKDRVELIDGFVVEKPVQKPPHASSLSRLQKRLGKLMPDVYELRIQLPITLSTSEPEPDAVIALGPEAKFDKAHPQSKDISLVVEVSDTSLEFDEGPKLLLYAAARLPEYWIINIPAQQIQVYSNFKKGKVGGYRKKVIYLSGDRVPLNLDGEQIGLIAVNNLLP